jgi:hypothetical protein
MIGGLFGIRANLSFTVTASINGFPPNAKYPPDRILSKQTHTTLLWQSATEARGQRLVDFKNDRRKFTLTGSVGTDTPKEEAEPGGASRLTTYHEERGSG